jgi:hypothetical protein
LVVVLADHAVDQHCDVPSRLRALGKDERWNMRMRQVVRRHYIFAGLHAGAEVCGQFSNV